MALAASAVVLPADIASAAPGVPEPGNDHRRPQRACRPATITSYEVIATKIEHEDHVTALDVPSTFSSTDSADELEVLALEASGNQTISLAYFTAAPTGGSLET